VPQLAHKHGVDKKSRTYSPWSHVVTMLYSQLVHALSLNDVCDGLRTHASKLITLRGATPPCRNTLSHANKVRDAAMAEELFWSVLNHLNSLCPRFGGRTYHGFPCRFKRMIHVVDATTIQLIAHCIDWARHRRRKAAAKLHLRLNLQCFLPLFITIDTARYHDSRYAREVCRDIGRGEIVLFDEAYVDFDHLFELDQRGVSWVTPAKDNMKFRCVKRRIRKRQRNILRDDMVVLTGLKTSKAYPQPLRRVVAEVEIDGEIEVKVFMTNNLEWAPGTIADLYKCRWSIETFFKQIKQTLQLCDFLGHSKNAILWQVWMALLLYALIRFLKFTNGWNERFNRVFCLLRATVWDRFNLQIYWNPMGQYMVIFIELNDQGVKICEMTQSNQHNKAIEKEQLAL
jgi:hypothetical protein